MKGLSVLHHVSIFLLLHTHVTQCLLFPDVPADQPLRSIPATAHRHVQMQPASLQSLYYNYYGFIIANDNSLLTPKTQSQQMFDSMALKTLQGTKWGLTMILNGKEGKGLHDSDNICRQQILIFQGFANQPNKWIVQSTCASSS